MRATASWAIFDMEYGGESAELTSPSGSVSTYTCSGSSCGRYTEWVDITSAAFALRQCASSSPVPSAFTVIAWSKSRPGPWNAARCTTYVKSSGTPEKSPVAMSHTRVVTPSASTLAATRLVGEAGDAPHLVVAREVTSERERDLAGGPGDEDLLARQHRRRRY